MEMMVEVEKFVLSKVKKISGMILGFLVMVGVFIGLVFLFYIIVIIGSVFAGWGLSWLVGGVVFSMGLILIVICGGELFISFVLFSILWVNCEISFGKMFFIWGKVYVGNFIGVIFLLFLVIVVGFY